MVRNKLVSVVGVNPPADIASGRIAEVRSRKVMAELKNICGKIPMDLHEKVPEIL